MHDWEVTGRWSLLKWNWNSFNSWNQQLEWSKWMSSCFYYCRQVSPPPSSFQSEGKLVPNRRARGYISLMPKGSGLLVLKNALSLPSCLLFMILMPFKQSLDFTMIALKGFKWLSGSRPACLSYWPRCVPPGKMLLLQSSSVGVEQWWPVPSCPLPDPDRAPLFGEVFAGELEGLMWLQGVWWNGKLEKRRL